MTAPDLGKAALWYAWHKLAVFPLVPGTKKPATARGLYDATTDPAQIRRWWAENPRYNIGINCGASGLLVVDADTYKTEGGTLDLAATVIANTAHGGTHFWYRMPEGKQYSNATGTLPNWLDIRGVGGYVVAPPSVLVEDSIELPYTFAPGCKPTDIQPADLPTDIADILEAAQATREALPVTFVVDYAAAPDLVRWRLSDDFLDLIHNGTQKGGRSEADQSVITALARAGATDDEIRAVFVHYPVGAKYQERGRGGDRYLAHSIGKARAWLEAHPPDPPPDPTCLPALRALRSWLQGAEFTKLLREHGINRPADYARTMVAIFNQAISRGASRLRLGSHQLGLLSGASHMTAKRHLAMLGAEGLEIKEKGKLPRHRDGLGLIDVSIDPAGFGKWIDLNQLLQTVNPINLYPPVKEVNSLQQFADDHLPDEAFIQYPRHFAVKMRPNADILPHGMSSTDLLILAVLSEHGEMTRAEICEVTGLTMYTVGRSTRRIDGLGLLLVYTGKPYRYDLHPNFEEVLDDLRPFLASYGIGQKRARAAAAARAAYCDRQLEQDARMPEDKEKAKLRARRDRYSKAEADHILGMEAMGLDPWVKLNPRRQESTIAHDDLPALTLEELAALDPEPPVKVPRPYTRIDHGEEWVSVHRPTYEQWQTLTSLPYAERYRLMGMAGYERGEIDAARRMAGKMGSGPRHFVGVGEPQRQPEAA